ncbi:U-box domain-containing protein [Arabidopsis thaliana]|uniref:RING-type E3 ubiquitin transferase n=1 Tax=Arabidopsis thaliana TaxID=3702 RepID=A0A1P8AZL8_ARATH|nr:U-box domain-containing protein [Arabidopsis thaliana]ANM62082.1 U-box domain-containing protein [Arabidopsis thaliana]|eukprot:NP_001324262.1 U-box domain-containing protein [Arabidopsis thaliana]
MMGKSGSQQLLMDEKIYVAVGSDLGNKSTLVWAIQNTGGKEFCIVHVHQPLYRKEKEKTQKILDKYLQKCRQMQVCAEMIHIKMESVEKGIIQLISERNVKKLVMGAASDTRYSMRMADLLSTKAIYIRQEAPATCCIWFTCKGYLVYKRESIMGNTSLEYASTSSGQDSVRSRGSVIPSRQFTISRGNGNVYQLAVFEAEKSKKEASLEAFKHQEVVKEKNEAIKRGKEWESAYLEELKQRKETEMELKKVREKLEKMRYISENRITESYMLVQKLQDKYNLATKVLRKAKEERDLLIKGRDIAIIEVEELRKEVSRSDEHREAPQYFICPISLVNKKVNMERNRRLYRISSQIKTFVFNVSGSDEGSTTSSRWIYI